MNHRSGEIAIAWHGLPHYAWRCMKASLEEHGASLLTTPGPAVAEAEARQIAAKKFSLRIIGNRNRLSWGALDLPVPRIFFHTGWAYPAFNRLADEVLRSGGSVISFVDNCWKNNPRQWLGAVAFRMLYQKRFFAIWVPGNSGSRLMQFLGARRIYTGLYAADPQVYGAKKNMEERTNRIVFVGQFIKRKAVEALHQAFQALPRAGWELLFVGQGPIALTNAPGIKVIPFQSPEKIAALLGDSKFLILPSYEEHWGVVVHEATLAGCGLILRNNIGAAADLATDLNTLFFQKDSELSPALHKAMEISVNQLQTMQEESLRLAARFSPELWRNTFEEIISNCADK